MKTLRTSESSAFFVAAPAGEGLKNARSRFQIYPNRNPEFFQMAYSVGRLNVV